MESSAGKRSSLTSHDWSRSHTNNGFLIPSPVTKLSFIYEAVTQTQNPLSPKNCTSFVNVLFRKITDLRKPVETVKFRYPHLELIEIIFLKMKIQLHFLKIRF